jgi:hypothetical protein
VFFKITTAFSWWLNNNTVLYYCFSDFLSYVYIYTQIIWKYRTIGITGPPTLLLVRSFEGLKYLVYVLSVHEQACKWASLRRGAQLADISHRASISTAEDIHSLSTSSDHHTAVTITRQKSWRQNRQCEKCNTCKSSQVWFREETKRRQQPNEHASQ